MEEITLTVMNDVFPSCLYSNDLCSMEAIISKSSKATTESGYAVSEDIIAIVSAIPVKHHNLYFSPLRFVS